MSRDPRLYLDDIISSCEKIQRYTHGMTFPQFVEDERTLDAVVRNIEIVGEAVRRIPEDMRRRHPEVEWIKIVALRNIVAHEYFGIDEEIIWDVVQNEVPLLLSQIQHILREEEP